MSKETITEMVEQTYTVVRCDICGGDIPFTQISNHSDLQPDGTDFHYGCLKGFIQEALSKHTPPLNQTKDEREA